MKIVFWGTSEFAVPALEALHGAGFDLVVITMPDQPVGRKKILTPPPVKITAEKLGLKVLQPLKLKDDTFFEEFSALGGPASGGKFQPPDFCVIAAYGKIIAERYINTPKYGFLNIHPSLLPKYRGPTPVQTAILNGDTETAVTIMQIDKDMDHGPIFIQNKYAIGPDDTFFELHDRLAQEGAKLLLEVIKNFNTLTPQEQDHDQATFCKIFTREDAHIDWSRSQQEIYNQIRALNPEPGTWTTWPSSTNAPAGKQDKILNIKKAALIDGKLSLITIQLEGKKETSMADFLSGHPEFDISQLK
ncbi:MAG: methionyl-tRNA formyltransferase [bacterium]|nr:methionyl-tRNA formyltransferase [bacterium]